MSVRSALTGFSLAAALSVLAACPIAAFAYANPGEPQGYLSDFAGMLSEEEATSITADLSAVASSGIAQIAVVTIPSLEGDTIENFAVRLFEDWKIGDAERDNGALLLIARDEREVRIEVGYGLEGDLTDAVSSRIIRNVITPNFQNEAYGAGVKDAVLAMAGALGIDSVASSSVAESTSLPRLPNNWIWLVFFIPIWITSVLARSKSWWAGGVLGGLIGTVVGIFAGFLYAGIIAIAVLIPVGLLFDFLVSRAYTRHKSGGGQVPPWWMGGGGMLGGGGGSFGDHGGFGGFGGGSSGGGGASGKW